MAILKRVAARIAMVCTVAGMALTPAATLAEQSSVGIVSAENHKARLTSLTPMPNFDKITAADLSMIQKTQCEWVEKPREFTDIAVGTGSYLLTGYKAGEYS